MRPVAIILLLAACVTPRATDTCTLAYEQCNNACFKAPNYGHSGDKCVETPGGRICPQENQLIDTVEAGKCFDRCEWDHKLCSK